MWQPILVRQIHLVRYPHLVRKPHLMRQLHLVRHPEKVRISHVMVRNQNYFKSVPEEPYGTILMSAWSHIAAPLAAVQTWTNCQAT